MTHDMCCAFVTQGAPSGGNMKRVAALMKAYHQKDYDKLEELMQSYLDVPEIRDITLSCNMMSLTYDALIA